MEKVRMEFDKTKFGQIPESNLSVNGKLQGDKVIIESTKGSDCYNRLSQYADNILEDMNE